MSPPNREGNDTSDWKAFIEAARRKIAIADYHAQRLRAELASVGDPSSSTPPIAIQASFEGVIISVMAAIDQVAYAAASARVFERGKEEDLVSGSFQRLAEMVSGIADWYQDPLGRDLRRIRVRMVHYQYAKTVAGLCWAVESAGTIYRGSRELSAYAAGAVEYGQRLDGLLDEVQGALERAGAG